MFVRDRMTSPVVTIVSNVSFHHALHLMQERKLRRLPVVEETGRLVGIVTERDLSLATSHYLQAQIDIDEIMCRTVISASVEMPITDAALLMVNHKIGGLPVVDSAEKVVGIITESDIFRMFVELELQRTADDGAHVPSIIT